MTPEEKAVVQAAIEWRNALSRLFVTSAGRLDEPAASLGSAVDALVYSCPECNAGGHQCPGCGDGVKHGEVACAFCNEPGIPDVRRRLADYLSEYAFNTVEEWMRIVQVDADVEEPGSSAFTARANWMGDGTFALAMNPYGGAEYGQYRLITRVEPLPDLPPIGPENDPAQAFEQEAPIWVPRTWVDVREGDRVRLGGIEADVLTARLYVAHVRDGGTGKHFDDIVKIHKAVDVRLDYEEGDGRILTMLASSPVEIELTESEVQAIESLGWENRLQGPNTDLPK